MTIWIYLKSLVCWMFSARAPFAGDRARNAHNGARERSGRTSVARPSILRREWLWQEPCEILIKFPCDRVCVLHLLLIHTSCYPIYCWHLGKLTYCYYCGFAHAICILFGFFDLLRFVFRCDAFNVDFWILESLR